MKNKTIGIILFFLIFSLALKSQFFVGYKTGYDFSTNRIEKLQKTSSFYQTNELGNGVPVFMYLGEGFYNAIEVGYKCKNISIDISAGGNVNNFNLNYLNEKNAYFQNITPYKTTYYDTLQLNSYFREFFDEFLTFEDLTFYQYRYNLYNINTSVSFYYATKSFDFKIKTGFSFNYLKIDFETDWQSNMYSRTQSAEFRNIQTKSIIFERPKVSWLIAFEADYRMSESYYFFFGFGYRPLNFTPVNCRVIAAEAYTIENGETVESINDVGQGEVEFLFPQSFTPIKYNFNTLNVSIGLRYFFNKNTN